MSNEEKPPFGVMPHIIWLEHRIQELMDGLTRNFGNRKATTSMIAWQEELRDILPKYLDLLENSEK